MPSFLLASSLKVLFVIDFKIELESGVTYSPLIIATKLETENSSIYLFYLASNYSPV